MNRRKVQTERNRASQAAWLEFSPHRARVMDRIMKSVEKLDRPSLCVLGAGNCNDLELRDCLDRCRSVTLIDFDRKAMEDALSRQEIESDSRLRLVEADLADLRTEFLEAKTWDIVLSTCLLSQLIENAVSNVDSDSQTASQIALRTSSRHLGSMMEMIATGGIGLLVSDFVSSDTMPELLEAADAQIPGIAKQCLVAGNFFSGTNPFPIRSKMAADYGLEAKIIPPWRWRLGKRAFLVYALEFQKSR